MHCSWKSTALACAASVAVASAQTAPVPVLAASATTAAQSAAATITPVLTLEQCIAAALEHDGRRKAADHGVEIADARRGQALSSRYPSLSANLSATRFDEDPNFVFPPSIMGIPASSITIPPMVMTLPANAFGPGFPPVPVPLPIPGSTMEIPAQVFNVPEQDVRLMDKTLYSGTLNAMYVIYTGGLAGARIAQARAGVDVARHERRQTAAELAFDVTRAYYGVVLAHKLRGVAADTYERMKVTLDLTESLYKTGSGRVKKTDYLRHSAMVDTIASMVTEFEAQERSARAALAMLIGWTGNGEPQVASDDFVDPAAAPAVGALVTEALGGNPQIGQIEAGLVASKAGVKAAQAGHLPKVALFADLVLLGNSYDAGVVSSRNKTTWSVGVGVQVPIFQGFRVVNEVHEARAAERKLTQLSAALREGVALEVRRTAIAIDKGQAQRTTTGNAYKTSTENRELHVRAYQDELVETKDMIESQLVEAVLAGQFFKVQYDLAEARARLDMLLGKAGARAVDPVPRAAAHRPAPTGRAMSQAPNESGPRGTRRCIDWRAVVAIAALAVGGLTAAPPADSDEPLHAGFMASMFSGVNVTDARAAMVVWAQEIARTRGMNIQTTATIYRDIDEARQAVDAGRVHLLLLSTEQLHRLQRPDFGEVLYAVRQDRLREEYFLLTKKGAFSTLAELKGKTILTVDGVDYDMSVAWLDTLLHEHGLATASQHFGRVTRTPKPARGVLPVYFGQADACVVTRTAFELLVELNPQIGVALAPLATSPPLVHGLLLLDRHYAPHLRPKLLDALQSLQRTPRGQQLLSIFGVERVTPGRQDDLSTSLDLLRALDRRQRGAK